MSHWRNLTEQEIATLQSNGNRATDWSKIFVAPNHTKEDCLLIEDCRFTGEVRIGKGTLMRNVRECQGYLIGEGCTLVNISELSADNTPFSIEVMNENGGRSIRPCPNMTVGQAYLWARYRGNTRVMEKLEQFTNDVLSHSEAPATIGPFTTIRNTQLVRNITIRSMKESPVVIDTCCALTEGFIDCGCHLEKGVIASRFLLGENVRLEFGLRLNDSVVGDNSTLARCEVGNSFIFPAHEQHHNNSFLIASLVMGQSNVAAGATIGSNHNSRTADNELAASRGFWPGLCTSLKHSSQFASYCLLAKADYPNELNITLPFALVNNNTSKNQLEVMPAYWWMYNMYALDRCSKKFAARDKRKVKFQHITFELLAPDTIEEIINGRQLIHQWTEESYLRASSNDATIPILAKGMEHSNRPTVLLKAAQGYEAYEEMLIHYAMQTLREATHDALPSKNLGSDYRITEWVNMGGQVVAKSDIEQMLHDIEKGVLSSWDDIQSRMNKLWGDYPQQVQRHAYMTLCHIACTTEITEDIWNKYIQRHNTILLDIEKKRVSSRKKDDTNPFRAMTYWSPEEQQAVLGQ